MWAMRDSTRYAAPVPIGSHDTGLSVWLRCVRAQVEILKRLLTEVAAGRELPRSSQDSFSATLFQSGQTRSVTSFLAIFTPCRRSGGCGQETTSPYPLPRYRPTLVIPNPRLTLWLDEVAVADRAAALDLAPGEVRVLDGELIVGCAAGSALSLKRAHIIESAGLPSEWSRAVGNLTS